MEAAAPDQDTAAHPPNIKEPGVTQIAPTLDEFEPKARVMIELASRHHGCLALLLPRNDKLIHMRLAAEKNFLYELEMICGGQIALEKDWNAETCITTLRFKPPHQLTIDQLKFVLEYTFQHELYKLFYTLALQAIYGE